jgi:hypothetical protein
MGLLAETGLTVSLSAQYESRAAIAISGLSLLLKLQLKKTNINIVKNLMLISDPAMKFRTFN